MSCLIHFLTAGSRQNFLHTLLTASGRCLVQGIPSAVVSTVHTETSLYQPPHPLPTARASCSSNTGDGVSVALCEVHVLLCEELGPLYKTSAV